MVKKYVLMLVVSIMFFTFGISSVAADGNMGEIVLNKTAVKNDAQYGRSATITLSIDSTAFIDIGKTDVVLVLDRSRSMDNNSKMINTKKAAKDLIDALINNNTKGKVRAAVVTYGYEVLDGTYQQASNYYADEDGNIKEPEADYTTSLTNNAKILKNTIDAIPDLLDDIAQGTNIQAGLKKAQSLLSSSGTDTKKIVILLSDGIPSIFTGSSKERCGNGSNDNADEDDNCKINGSSGKPSVAAKNVATTMKNSTNNIEIFTVGFGISENEEAQSFLKAVSTNPDSSHSYLANTYGELVTAFNSMVKNYVVVATGATVEDIVPSGFRVKEDTLPSGATLVAGDTPGTTKIVWNVGNVNSSKTHTLSYEVEAIEEYGSMYTNVSATLTATSAKGNPIYGSSQSVSLDFEKPIIQVPGVTVDDNYTENDTYFVKQGTTLTVNNINGILANDKLGEDYKNLDGGATVTDRIVLVSDTGSTAGNLNKINIDPVTGAFTFTADSTMLNNITYKYYVETTITLNGQTTTVKSNTSTITLKVVKYPTEYIVNYFEQGTTNKVANSKEALGNAYESVTENAIDIKGYNKVNPISTTIELAKENNVINFYYTKRTDLSYTVNYLEKGTNKVLADAKVVEEQTYLSEVTEEAIEIKGYNKVEPTEVTITIDVEGNVINFYYTAKEVNYTVNYFLKDTITKIKDSKNLVAIFGTKVKSSLYIEEIFGYTYDSSNIDELTIAADEENNIINLYYVEVRGTVKAIYVDKEGNEISDSIITEGRIGTEYKTEAKEIEKYILVEVKGAMEDEYTEEEIVVTYIYEMVPNTGLFENNISGYGSIISLILLLVLTFVKKKIFN